MGGSVGKGKEASQQTSNTDPRLVDILEQTFRETTPLRQNLISQFEEVLKTGGAGAQIPFINKATEASRSAESSTLKGLDERLAQQNLAGTPFGEIIRSQTASEGRLATSRIPSEITQALLQLIPNFVLGQGQTVVSGFAPQAQGGSAGSTFRTGGGFLTTGS